MTPPPTPSDLVRFDGGGGSRFARRFFPDLPSADGLASLASLNLLASSAAAKNDMKV